MEERKGGSANANTLTNPTCWCFGRYRVRDSGQGTHLWDVFGLVGREAGKRRGLWSSAKPKTIEQKASVSAQAFLGTLRGKS